MNIEIFNPNKRKGANGFYWVNCTIISDDKPKCKCVMGKTINKTEISLIGNRQYDFNWKPSNYKDGWYERMENVTKVTFFDFP